MSNEVNKDRLEYLINLRNTIWAVILGICLITAVLLLSFDGWIKIVLAGLGIFSVLLLYFVYRNKTREITRHFDEIFPLN